ncbi:MAG: FAD binding domain-containing protein [Anaerolineae bacterium]|nr:FAD binding domain-containing protein [Anaerolineae bacterium]MCX8067750.1 FAD binding domain-containing protein [Anaerolineae bacterium]MDW7991814.1 FAD binding domain-containing protein [Anaerolineae bacterium]
MSIWQTYFTPTSAEEVLRLLAEYGTEARIIAGGTDLLLELERGVRRASVLIDISRTPGLDGIALEGDRVRLGPLVTHNRLAASPIVAEHLFPLAQAAWSVGAPAIRNRGTLGGNLVTASPSGDTIPPLMALGATLVLRSVRGERRVPIQEFFEGNRQVNMAPDEMLVEVQVPAMRPGERGVFLKLGLRRALAVSVVNVAVVVRLEDQLVTRARIAMGSVAPTVLRACEAEGALVGSPLSSERIEEAADLAARAAIPIDDIRAGAEYRREMVRTLVRRALTILAEKRERDGFPAHPPFLWGRTGGKFPYVVGKTVRHTVGGDEPIECTVNGKNYVVRGANGKTLLRMLREDLGLTGTKEGCGEGVCGTCTVWLDGIVVVSCLVPAPRAHGAQIVTIEGLARGEKLHPLQQAFIDEGAVQCGYCTPGFIMSGAKLLEEIPSPDREQILHAIAGNLCRCTGYYKVVRAIERAAKSAIP